MKTLASSYIVIFIRLMFSVVFILKGSFLEVFILVPRLGSRFPFEYPVIPISVFQEMRVRREWKINWRSGQGYIEIHTCPTLSPSLEWWLHCAPLTGVII